MVYNGTVGQGPTVTFWTAKLMLSNEVVAKCRGERERERKKGVKKSRITMMKQTSSSFFELSLIV